MMQCAQDRDLYKLGHTIARLIPRNEFSISEGGFQAINKFTGKPEFADVGLPFKMWVDALPVCAKAIRERGKPGEEDFADMLDMKFFVLRSRISEAIVIAKRGVERNPKLPYPYYIMTLGDDLETGLRCAKKGLKCKNVTPFVSHALRARATEIAGDLAISRMQGSTVGDQKWEHGQAFLNSALEDAQMYLAQAPPDMRHRKSMIYWCTILTLAKKGPELSTDLREFQVQPFSPSPYVFPCRHLTYLILAEVHRHAKDCRRVLQRVRFRPAEISAPLCTRAYLFTLRRCSQEMGRSCCTARHTALTNISSRVTRLRTALLHGWMISETRLEMMMIMMKTGKRGHRNPYTRRIIQPCCISARGVETQVQCCASVAVARRQGRS